MIEKPAFEVDLSRAPIDDRLERLRKPLVIRCIKQPFNSKWKMVSEAVLNLAVQSRFADLDEYCVRYVIVLKSIELLLVNFE